MRLDNRLYYEYPAGGHGSTGLSPDFKICEGNGCTELTFSDITGAYNVDTNSTGWGAPNEDLANAYAAVLDVTRGDGEEYSVVLTGEGFPTSDTTLEYLIPNEDIGYTSGDTIPDQIMNVIYTVTVLLGGTTYTYTTEKNIAFYCNAKCCVLNMFKNLDLTCESCDSSEMKNALQAYALLKALIYQAQCGNSTDFNVTLAQIQKLCNTTSDGCGCS